MINQARRRNVSTSLRTTRYTLGMPVHDWTRVSAGTFHAFHNAWISHLQEALNNGVLPQGYYALGEQRAGDVGPDLLTLRTPDAAVDTATHEDEVGGVMLAESPPKVAIVDETDADAAFYLAKQRTLVVYHASGDRIVALVEIVSPANKRGPQNVERFVNKALSALAQGYHLLLIDLFPPGPADPHGMHAEVWDAAFGLTPYEPPPARPLTLASYCAGTPIRSYVEPRGFGETLTDMPLFVSPVRYVNVPLETTYTAAWRGMPQRWRQVLETD